jgi:hypothetical protein
MKALKFIEKERTLVIMMYPIRMNEMYCVISWNVCPREKCRSYCANITRRVMGSADSFRPRIVFRTVRKMRDME